MDKRITQAETKPDGEDSTGEDNQQNPAHQAVPHSNSDSGDSESVAGIGGDGMSESPFCAGIVQNAFPAPENGPENQTVPAPETLFTPEFMDLSDAEIEEAIRQMNLRRLAMVYEAVSALFPDILASAGIHSVTDFQAFYSFGGRPYPLLAEFDMELIGIAATNPLVRYQAHQDGLYVLQ